MTVQVSALNPSKMVKESTLTKYLSQALSELLEDVYAESPDSPDSLLVVHDKETIPSAGDKELQPTTPPVSTSPTSDFHNATIASLPAHVQETAGNGPFSRSYFSVVDKRTAEDKTVLLVKCPKHTVKGDDEGANGTDIESVRVASSQGNALVVAMQVGSGSLEELKSNIGKDGVYRDSTGPVPKKGEPAPRKLLGGGK